MRISKKDVENKFIRFIDVIGGFIAKDHTDVGGYQLDYNSIYGGYVITQICNVGGGESRPFGDSRSKNTEMWYKLDFAEKIAALNVNDCNDIECNECGCTEFLCGHNKRG